MGVQVFDVRLVVHADAAIQHVLSGYLEAYKRDTSIAVVASSRIDSVARRPWLAGWHITDCATRYERTGGVSGDELIIETSGTVAEPKMVRYQKSTIRSCAHAIADALHLSRRRHYLSVMNPRFAYGLSVIHSHAVADVPVYLETAPISLDQWAMLRDRLTPNSSVYLAPHHSFLLTQDASWQLRGPIELIFAGGLVTQSMIDQLKMSFPEATITKMYGQSELGPRVAIGSTPIDDFREYDVGRPLTGVQVRAAGDGSLEVMSPFRMTGYLTQDGTPPTALTSSVEDLWWPTGDVGYVSADGRVHVTGRDAGDVNFLGSRVRLSELRDVVRAVPGVLDARLLVNKHHIYGEQPCVRAMVRTREGDHETAIRRALGAAMGTSAGAVQIIVVDGSSLPESGKL